MTIAGSVPQQEPWVSERIEGLRVDRVYQDKVRRIREGVTQGTFIGRVMTDADWERLGAEAEI